MTIKKQIIFWAIFWFVLSFCFAFFIYAIKGFRSFIDFLSVYLIELTLSFDNLIVFAMIFKSFNIPFERQNKPLFIGIIGAIVSRAILIILGISLITKFKFCSYIFGVILLCTSYKMFFGTQTIPFIKNFSKRKTMFWCVVCIEFADVIFAIDSVPAALAITTDKFIVYSANIFALLGLRTFYLLISGLEIFNKGASILLFLIGIKMIFQIHLSPLVILSFIVFILFLSILFERKRVTGQ